MIRKFTLTALGFAALIGAAAPAAMAQDEQTQQPATTVKATHEAWQIVCDANNPDTCLMTQVGKRGDGQPILRVSLRKTPGATGPEGQAIAGVMQMEAPLGVLLPAGIALSIDGREIGRSGYKVCNGRACIASEPLAADFVNQFKQGVNAQLTVVGLNGDEENVQISLAGFTDAYNGL